MKPFTLLLCLFCVFSLSIAQECNIGYEDYPADPVCKTVTGPDGNPTQECTAVGSAAFAAQLTPSDNSFTEKFAVSYFSWDGTCDCTVTYWRDGNGEGCYVRRSFGSDGDGSLTSSGEKGVLKVRPGSITITCQF